MENSQPQIEYSIAGKFYSLKTKETLEGEGIKASTSILGFNRYFVTEKAFKKIKNTFSTSYVSEL